MTAPVTVDEWRAFGFRMSKKVAELSVVVHDLFAKNHEREVEIEELRDAYEEEIARVIGDAKRRLEVIAEVSHENEQRLRAEQASEMAEAAADREAALSEGRSRLQGLMAQLQHERAEREALRSRLARVQRELDGSRRGVQEELAARDKDLAASREEAVALRRRLAAQERGAREAEQAAREERAELEAETARARAQLGRAREERAAAAARVRQLEDELRALRAVMLRRGTAGRVRGEADGGEERQPGPEAHPESEWTGKESRESIRSTASLLQRPVDMDTDLLLEEVEQLRQQVQQYKMELSNRDANFNKVFSTRGPRSSSPKRPTAAAGPDRLRRSLVTKERTFSYIISQTPATAQEHTPYLRRSSLQTSSNQTAPRSRGPLPSIVDRTPGQQQRVTMKYLDNSASKSLT